MRTSHLSDLKVFIPICQLSSLVEPRSPGTVRLSRDLERRLIDFALEHGAVRAEIDRTGAIPALVSISENGTEIRTSLTHNAGDWYWALNRMDALNHEDECAGLNRLLRVRSPSIAPKRA